MKIWEIEVIDGKKYEDNMGNIWVIEKDNPKSKNWDLKLFEDGGYISKMYLTSTILSLDFKEHIEDVDWTKIEIDTKVLVSMIKNFNKGVRKHFAGVFNGKPCVWVFGNTSWTTDVVEEWDYIKLAEEENE